MTRGCLSLRHSPSPSSTRSVFISFSGVPPPGHLHRPAVLTGLRVSFTNAAICHCPALAASPQGGTERKAATAWNAHASLLTIAAEVHREGSLWNAPCWLVPPENQSLNCIDLNHQWNHLLFFVFSSLEGHTPVNLLFCCSGCSISLLLLKGPQISQFLTSQGKGIAAKRIIMMMMIMNNNNNNNNERNFVWGLKDLLFQQLRCCHLATKANQASLMLLLPGEWRQAARCSHCAPGPTHSQVVLDGQTAVNHRPRLLR